MREGDRWKWADDPRYVGNLELEVINGRIMVTKGRAKGEVWSPNLDTFPHYSLWEYLGNFSKSDNFNSLYEKLSNRD